MEQQKVMHDSMINCLAIPHSSNVTHHTFTHEYSAKDYGALLEIIKKLELEIQSHVPEITIYKQKVNEL